MNIRHIIGLLLLLGAVGCLGLSHRDSVRSQLGYTSKTKGWVPMGPEQDVPLSSFDRTAYMVVGFALGLGGIYCFAMPWIHRRTDDAKTKPSV